MNTSTITSVDIYRRLEAELEGQEYCTVTLQLTIHQGDIVRWRLERSTEGKRVAPQGQKSDN